MCVCTGGNERFSTYSLECVLSQGEFLLTVQSHVLDLIGPLKQQFQPGNIKTHTYARIDTQVASKFLQ